MSVFKSEPVRAAVYSVAVAVCALLVAAGVIDNAVSGCVTAVASMVLLGATEAARSVVTPVAKMRREQKLS